MEAIPRTKEVDEMKTLVKEIPLVFVTLNGPIFETDSQGWQLLDPASGYVMCSNYFDLAGLAMDEKTIMFNGAAVQNGGVPNMTGAAGDKMYVWDIITTIPVDFAKASNYGNLVNFPPGFLGSTLNFEHVTYQRLQVFTLDVDAAAKQPMRTYTEQSGSLSATASDRLYSYRIIAPDPGAPLQITSFGFGAARHVLDVKTEDEPTYQYLMRLKRSYDLQQQPDRD